MTEKDTSFRWHHWSVAAEKPKLLELLTELDATLPSGWRKLTESELGLVTRPAPEVIGRYGLAPKPGRHGVTLHIELLHETELCGGHMFGMLPSTTTELATTTFPGHDVDRFIDDGLISAAEKVGVKVRKGTVGEIFFDELPWEVREALTVFNSTTRKALPLNWAEGEAWQAFVVAAYRSSATFDRELMSGWFAANGWPGSVAEVLSRQFFDECRLLDRYRDALVVA